MPISSPGSLGARGGGGRGGAKCSDTSFCRNVRGAQVGYRYNGVQTRDVKMWTSVWDMGPKIPTNGAEWVEGMPGVQDSVKYRVQGT